MTVPYLKAKMISYTSRAGHVESGLNMGGPSPKAKYSLTTDSEK